MKWKYCLVTSSGADNSKGIICGMVELITSLDTSAKVLAWDITFASTLQQPEYTTASQCPWKQIVIAKITVLQPKHFMMEECVQM